MGQCFKILTNELEAVLQNLDMDKFSLEVEGDCRPGQGNAEFAPGPRRNLQRRHGLDQGPFHRNIKEFASPVILVNSERNFGLKRNPAKSSTFHFVSRQSERMHLELSEF